MKTQLTPIIRTAQKANNESLNTHYKVQAAIGFILNNYEPLKGTRLYSQKIDNLGKRFYKALDEREKEICQFNPTCTDKTSAMEQLNDSYIVFENIMDALFEIPYEKLKQFSFQIEELKKVYVNK